MKTILFVCTGNTCRSPMAEAIARNWLERGAGAPDGEFFVASAGVSAPDGMSVSPETVRSLGRLNIECSGKSKPLTAEMIQKADVVLCMTAGHMTAALELLGPDDESREIVELLNPDGDISDPMGRGQRAYDDLAEELTELIPRRLTEILNNEGRARIRPSRR